jgi:GT2 family glycosyltransferase
MQVFILGMHRSGTSIVTRLINLMGAYFGPEGSSTGANEENPKGFWERRDVRNLNDAVLASLDCDWHRVRGFALERVPAGALEEFERGAREVLLDLDAHQPWVIKEPRLCLLLPLWRRLLEKPVCVMVHRSPLQVARSLEKRNEFPLSAGIALWERYAIDSLRSSRDLPRLLIGIDDLMADPVGTVRDLYTRLSELGVTGLHCPDESEILSFVTPELYHHERDGKLQQQLLAPAQEALARSMRDGSALSMEEIPSLSPASEENLELHEKVLRLKADLESEEDRLARAGVTIRELEEKLREFEEMEQRCAGLELRTRELQRSKEEAEDAYRRRTVKYREVEKAYAMRKGQLKQLEAEYNALLASRAWKVARAVRGVHRRLTLKHWQPTPQPKTTKGSGEELIPRPPQDSVSAKVESVDIVVCVHNALDDVRRCLESVVIATRATYGLIVINDGSDEETSVYLREFAERHPACRLLESAEATGYTRAANRGLQASIADFIVLLNSDTIVSREWLEGIRKCLASDSTIGIAGPLSNAASWQSVPQQFDPSGDWAINELPDGWSVDQMGALVRSTATRCYPRVPFVNGFCFAIRRPVIDAIGYLDEESFPRGYGEENDLCRRAAAAGFELAIVDSVYVFHAKSKSFSHETRHELARAGGAALKAKHGAAEIKKQIEVIREHPGLAAVSDRVVKALERAHGTPPSPRATSPLRVLFLLPVKGGGGGVHSIVQDTIGMRTLGCDAMVAVPEAHVERFRERYSTVDPTIFHGFNEHLLEEYAARFDVVVATIFTSVKLLADLAKSHPEVLLAYYIQDYEPWITQRGTELHEEAKRSYTLIPEMVQFAKTDWICRMVEEMHGTPVHKVAPSLDTSVYFPPVALMGGAAGSPGPVRISAMIRPKTPRRGATVTMEVLSAVQRELGDKVSITVFGCDSDDPQFSALRRDFDFENRGVLLRPAVGELLRASDVFVDFSVYQAFGRTALEAMACGCAVIVPESGGASEYAIDHLNSLVVDTSSRTAMIDSLTELVVDGDLRRRLTREGVRTALGYSILRAATTELEVFQAALAERSVVGRPTSVPCGLEVQLDRPQVRSDS